MRRRQFLRSAVAAALALPAAHALPVGIRRAGAAIESPTGSATIR